MRGMTPKNVLNKGITARRTKQGAMLWSLLISPLSIGCQASFDRSKVTVEFHGNLNLPISLPDGSHSPPPAPKHPVKSARR